MYGKIPLVENVWTAAPSRRILRKTYTKRYARNLTVLSRVIIPRGYREKIARRARAVILIVINSRVRNYSLLIGDSYETSRAQREHTALLRAIFHDVASNRALQAPLMKLIPRHIRGGWSLTPRHGRLPNCDGLVSPIGSNLFTATTTNDDDRGEET